MPQAIENAVTLPTATPVAASAADRTNWLPTFLWPPAPAPAVEDPAEVQRLYNYFRPRILIWSTIGYGVFYFVRRNYDAVMPVLGQQLGISKSMLGLILTLHGVLYGISKFANGVLADRANSRLFMALALIACACLNLIFGVSSSLTAFTALWMLNGWFQGMGFPPCARLLTHWFPPKVLATRMSIWNSSHTLGAGLIVIMCGLIMRYTGNWRLCFILPAVIALITAGLLLAYLRDTPESIGLPEPEGTAATSELEANASRSTADFNLFLKKRVFGNKYIWLASIANFFVYTIRLAVFSWGTTLLKEMKGINLANSAMIVGGFELAGLVGMLLTGWLTDQWFRGRGAPLSAICMLMCGVAIALFWKLPASHSQLSIAILISAGFFVYGPQALVAVIMAQLATKRGTATAIGLTSVFGYASTILSGLGLGYVVQHYGWDHVFGLLIACAAAGAVLFVLVLPARTPSESGLC